MSSPYIGELRIFSFGFAPKGWALCNGQLLPINQNQALFSILGTTYGGNGTTTFALPNLQGRVPTHFGAAVPQGQSSGEETHTLVAMELPNHNHPLRASTTPGNVTNPSGAMLGAGNPPGFLPYAATAGSQTNLVATSISSAGGGQPHENRQPYLVLNLCIALQGIFPSRE